MPPALALALATSSAGCSLILDFSDYADASTIDAPLVAIDAAMDGGGTDASAACVAHEPNDVRNQAVAAGSSIQAAICPIGDHDFYSFAADGLQDVVLDLTFSSPAQDRDLDLALIYPDDTVFQSTGFEEFERIERTEATASRLAAGNYLVEVWGFNDDIDNDYDLQISITSTGM